MILVDELVNYPDEAIGPRARRYGSRWAHLVSTSGLEELLAFADRLGLRHKHLQSRERIPHFDLTPGMHRLALELGATLDRRAITKAWRP